MMQDQAVALGDSTCLPLPMVPPLNTLLAVWSDGNQDDCVCPQCNDANCMMYDCHCYNTTSLMPTLSTNQLCWPHSSNNSNIYFITQARICDSTGAPFVVSTFVAVTTLVVRGNIIYLV